MKTRTGFVSNSSSSSFIVGFDKKPETVEELKNLLFDEDQEVFVGLYDDAVYPVQQVVQTVFDDLRDQNEATKDEIYNTVLSGHVNGMPRSSDFRRCNGETAWDAYFEACDDYRGKYAEDLINKFKDKKIFIFEYSDNDGPYYTALEHGDLFDRINYVRVSHH